ncbi:MAG: hypothetical protein IKB40_02085 [Paludibacteraceae bacterium]|nr:hypothetical protein [Paludibacteraceae bacterium]
MEKKIKFAIMCVAIMCVGCEQNIPDDPNSNKKGENSTSGVTQPTENNHAYVDLGLSVKWATCNVGASEPEEYGNYYAWGEITPKSTYSWDNYKWSEYDYWDGIRDVIFTKYDNELDYKYFLDKEDDVASVNWGGKWRMPTRKEQQELINKCSWTWKTKNDINGFEVKGPNGNTIFLPAAGSMQDQLNKAGMAGRYSSKELDPQGPSNTSFSLEFNMAEVDYYYQFRYEGYTVRPVFN